MKSIRKTLSVALFCALLGGALPSAFAADGLAISATQIPVSARTALAAQIADHRASNPAAFESLAHLRGHKPEVYKRFRNPVPLVGRELRRLGEKALLPMLSALAFEAPVDSARTEGETTALTIGMLEVVGELRDARSAPVLTAVFEASAKKPRIALAAAIGLGRLCRAEEATLLETHAAKAGALQIAAISGLGYCRRESSALKLAEILASSKDAGVMEAAAKALGVIGSSWAWKAASKAGSSSSGEQVRAIAAKALVSGFARVSEEARAPFQAALMMVDHESTKAWILNAKVNADTRTSEALDKLLLRVERASRP